MDRHENVVWEGRFQPFHNGHLAYIRLLLARARHVWVWVVANEQSCEVAVRSPVPDFTKEVDPHHRPEKNVVPFWLRYRIVVESIRDELGEGAVTVCGGRRLDLAWDLYKKILPPNRVFLTPERDVFEDAKARAWNQLGERCERVDVSSLPPLSGTLVRERWQRGEDVADLLPRRSYELLREYGYLQALREDGG